MTINIIWAENKRNLSTHKTQIKTFNSSKEADDCISPYDIMDCLLEETRDGIRFTF